MLSATVNLPMISSPYAGKTSYKTYECTFSSFLKTKPNHCIHQKSLRTFIPARRILQQISIQLVFNKNSCESIKYLAQFLFCKCAGSKYGYVANASLIVIYVTKSR